MISDDYLSWLSTCAPTTWWHDSADPGELEDALSRGAVGVTTNPVLVPQALKANADLWEDEIARALREANDAGEKAEQLMRIPVTHAAGRMRPIYDGTSGESGYVCAQVDPSLAGDREGMYAMGRRFAEWAPNIAVKLPATAAGLDVLERLTALGITVTATVSFTVAQVTAVAERYQSVIDRRGQGGRAGRCFAVLMIGRIDDYLREVWSDSRAGIPEVEIQQAGLATARRACAIFREKGFRAKLLVAAFRQTHQIAGMCGGDAVLSIHPKYQKALREAPLPRERRFDREIDPEVMRRLSCQDEFRRSFADEAIPTRNFISYGLTQRTLAQFVESGWKLLESFERSPGKA
jgi:transaldolase